MSILLSLLLVADPAVSAPEAPKKPKMRCEWIHEVGSARPRRHCVPREEPKPAGQPRAETPQHGGAHGQPQGQEPLKD